MQIKGNIVDVINKKIAKGIIEIQNNIISSIRYDETVKQTQYILPGFIDSHIHIESSMLIPSEFARIAVVHGTVACVSDPHEIANILGLEGIEFMIQNAKKVPMKFYFSCPTCVPATPFETSGAVFGLKEMESLIRKDEIKYMGEFMNFPGVIYDDDLVIEKIKLAKKYKKPIDGHAPGLTGKDLSKYIKAGISTDHEAFSYEEGEEKINKGMKIQIREGSAVQNFDELVNLIDRYAHMCMFASDDKHPDELVKAHINQLVKRAVDKGIDIFKVLNVACINPIKHYDLDVGMLQPNQPADFIVIDNLKDFNVKQTYINGNLVSENGKTKMGSIAVKPLNNFQVKNIKIKDLKIYSENKKPKIRVIEIIDGQLITKSFATDAHLNNKEIISDVKSDILKIVVLNRYDKNSKPAIGFIKNFGLQKGAIASSIAHDSHNIIAVGTNDTDMLNSINLIIENKGGITAVCKETKISDILPLPIAGILSSDKYENVSKKYLKLDKFAKQFGSKLKSPFMTLSFMALLVIPELKLSDKGLFDGNKFKFIDLEI